MKIIPESHLDHGLTKAQVEHVAHKFRDRKSFFTEEINLGEAGLGTVPCALHGPAMGDEPIGDDDVVYLKREGRLGTTRFIDREPRMVGTVTVIAGPDGDEPCVLYTAFGGPLAPREPADPDMQLKDVEESKAFWAEHALSKSVLLEPDVRSLFDEIGKAIVAKMEWMDTLEDVGLMEEFIKRAEKGTVGLVKDLFGAVAAAKLEEAFEELNPKKK